MAAALPNPTQLLRGRRDFNAGKRDNCVQTRCAAAPGNLGPTSACHISSRFSSLLPASVTAYAIAFHPCNKRHASGGPSLLTGLPIAPPLLVELQGEKPCPEALTDSRLTISEARTLMRTGALSALHPPTGSPSKV